MRTTTLSGKIREQVSRDEELRAQKEAMREHESMLAALVDRPQRGTSRAKAHRGEATAKVDRARRRARVGKASRQRNRR